MYTSGAGRILLKSNIIVCLLNLMAWKASWAHRTGEKEEKKDNDKIKNRSKRRAPVVSITVCIAFTGNLQKHELADYLPIKRKKLDLIFMQTSHFLVEIYTSTLYFNIFRLIPNKSCHKQKNATQNI